MMNKASRLFLIEIIGEYLSLVIILHICSLTFYFLVHITHQSIHSLRIARNYGVFSLEPNWPLLPVQCNTPDFIDLRHQVHQT